MSGFTSSGDFMRVNSDGTRDRGGLAEILGRRTVKHWNRLPRRL